MGDRRQRLPGCSPRRARVRPALPPLSAHCRPPHCAGVQQHCCGAAGRSGDPCARHAGVCRPLLCQRLWRNVDGRDAGRGDASNARTSARARARMAGAAVLGDTLFFISDRRLLMLSPSSLLFFSRATGRLPPPSFSWSFQTVRFSRLCVGLPWLVSAPPRTTNITTSPALAFPSSGRQCQCARHTDTAAPVPVPHAARLVSRHVPPRRPGLCRPPLPLHEGGGCFFGC